MAADSQLRRQLVRDELSSMRRLGRDRRDASTRLPVLSRTGPLARKPGSDVVTGSIAVKKVNRRRDGRQ